MKGKIALIVMVMFMPGYIYAEPGTFDVDIDGTSYTINYDATDIVITDISPDVVSLVVEVTVTESVGTLEMTFDRSFFVATSSGLDDDFVVVADGSADVLVNEIATSDDSRTIRFEVQQTTDELYIVGTALIPSVQVEPPTKEPVEEPTEEPITEPPTDTPLVEPIDPPKDISQPTPVDTLTTQCGPGTVLENGACVLDKVCGEGTIFKDGVCVLAQSTTPQSMNREFIIGAGAALFIALFASLVFWIISRGSRRRV